MISLFYNIKDVAERHHTKFRNLFIKIITLLGHIQDLMLEFKVPISAFHKYFILSEVLYTLLWRAMSPSCNQHTPPWKVTNVSLILKNTYGPGGTKYGWCPWFFTIFREFNAPRNMKIADNSSLSVLKAKQMVSTDSMWKYTPPCTI